MSEKRRSEQSLRTAGSGAAAGNISGQAAGRKFTGSARVKRSYALLWRQTIWGIGAAAAAFLLGRCPLLFQTRPLGIALLCAATNSIPYLYGGLLLSALTAETGTVMLCCTYSAALLIRVLSRSAIELPGAGRAPYTATEETEELSQAPTLTDEEPRKRRSRPYTAAPSGNRGGALTALRALWERGGALMSHWFSESIYLRMMTACVCAFIVSLYTIIAGGFLYYDLFGAFFAMVTAPAATFLYAGLFSTGVRKRTARARAESDRKPSYRELRRTVAIAALTFSLLYALREIDLLGISVTAFLGFAITLAVSRRKGFLNGLLAGVICGIAYSPVITPSFVLAALVFGLLHRRSLVTAAFSSCVPALAWGFYPLGMGTLTSLLPAFLAAALLLCASDKLLSHPSVLFELVPDIEHLETVERTDITRQRAENGERRMRELSETFSALAGIFYSLSDRMRRPGLLDLRRMCDRAFDSTCPDCPQRDLCWGADYAGTLTQLSRLAASLHENGCAEEATVDMGFRERCAALPDLIDRMNAECARMTEAALHTEKTEIFAMDFDGLSQVLSDALEEQNAEFLYDEELSDRVHRALADMDLHAQGVLVWGKRQRQIVARGVDASASGLGTAQIHDQLEEACGFSLGEIYFDLSDTGVTMRVSSRPCLSTRRAVRTMAAHAGVCGDTANVFDTDRDCTYALISDGMGSGQEAAFTSGLCSLFVEKMLSAGNHTDTSLRMLNNMIRQKGGGIGMECSSTIDLMELDLLTGKAVFLKSGASPTYVRRDDCLFKLHAQTAPIGILRSVDAQRITYDALPGDVVIMLSDGVGAEESSSEDCPWLLDLLADGWQNDLNAMAETILTRARKEGSQDDLSVILIEIIEA